MEFVSLTFRLDFREFCVSLAIRQIDDIFQMAKIAHGDLPPDRVISGERRRRVEEYYGSINWANQNDCEKFLEVVRLGVSQSYIPKESKDFVFELCKKEGWVIDGYNIRLPASTVEAKDDLFKLQFPAGLPFGVPKPDFAVTSNSGGQSLKFELKSGIGIIWKDIYPDYDFQTFQAACGITSETNLTLKKALLVMNQTEAEREFFQAYARNFKMAEAKVPLLIPQAWIQWHSLPKSDLRFKKSLQAEEPYRLDFVAFWKNRRFAIFIDDISHYGVKRGTQWLADEAAYSKGLDDERKLQVEGWTVCKVSNWEIKNSAKLIDILTSLQKIIDF